MRDAERRHYGKDMANGSGMIEPDRLFGLLDRHAAGLELYARQWSRRPEDIVQEAFIALAGLVDVPRQPAAWLYATVRNLARTDFRALERRIKHEREAGSEAAAWFEPQLDDQLDAQSAAQALAEIDLDCREPIVLHLWGGLSFDEIGKALEISSSAAHRRYRAGLAALRGRLGVELESLAKDSNHE